MHDSTPPSKPARAVAGLVAAYLHNVRLLADAWDRYALPGGAPDDWLITWARFVDEDPAQAHERILEDLFSRAEAFRLAWGALGEYHQTLVRQNVARLIMDR